MKKQRAMLSFILSLALLCSFVLPSLAASYQNGDKARVDISDVEAFHGGRDPGETLTSNGGNRGYHYNNRLYWYEGYCIDILQIVGSQYTPQYDAKTYLYCIHKWESYGDRGNGSVEREFYTDPTGNGNLMNSPYWASLSREKRDLLMLASMYGFPARTPQELGVSTVDDAYAATQAIIWEIVTGRRTLDGFTKDYTSAGNEDTPKIAQAKDNATYFHDVYMHYAYTGNGHTAGEATPALAAYNKIWADIAGRGTIL